MAAPSIPVRNNGCFASLACSIGSISIAFSSLTQIPNTTDRISLQRGLFLTSLGFIYFVSLTDFCNKYLLETKHGQQFRKKYRLMLSDVLEITNKIVSAVQAFFSFLVGLIVCKSTCSKSFVYASHFLMEAYGWFGTAYFMYDIWSMYKVHTQMLADKLKLKNLSMKFDGSKDGGANQSSATANGIANKKHSNKDGKLKMNGNCNHKNGKMIGNGNGSILERPQRNGGGGGGGIIVSPKLNQSYDDSLYEEANLKSDKYQSGSRMEFFKYVFTHPVMMIHHIFIGTFGFLVVTYIRGGGHCIYSYMFMMEFSTPFVSLRSILSTMHLKDTKLYIVNGLTMLVAFFVCRVFMWPYVMWRYSLAINTTFWQALSGLPKGCIISILILFLPQIYWFYLMVRGALKVFFPSSSSKKQKNRAGIKAEEDEVLMQNNNSCMESAIKETGSYFSEHQNQHVPGN